MNHLLETILVYGTAAGILAGIGWLFSFILSGGKLRGELIANALEDGLSNPETLEEYWRGMENQAATINDPSKKQAAIDHVTNLRARFQMIKNNAAGFKKLNRQEKATLGDLVNNANGLEESLSKITDPVLRGEKQIEIKKINDEIERLITIVPTELDSIPQVSHKSIPLSYGVAADDLRSEINLLTANAVSNRDAALKAINELVQIDPEFDKLPACQEIEMRYQNELKNSQQIAVIAILKKKRDSDLMRTQENAKVAGLLDEQIAENLARINKKYEDQIAKLELNA